MMNTFLHFDKSHLQHAITYGNQLTTNLNVNQQKNLVKLVTVDKADQKKERGCNNGFIAVLAASFVSK